MQSDSSSDRQEALAKWTTDLACPACYQPLRLENTTVVCTGCERAYPILDGIPVLIPERASRRESAGRELGGHEPAGKDGL